MTPDQLKKAASDLADLERIGEILNEIAAGSSLTLQVGTNVVHINKERSASVVEAIEAYLRGTQAVLQQKLAQSVEGIKDPFDAALETLEQEARPK